VQQEPKFMSRETESQPGWQGVLAKIPMFSGFAPADLDRLSACAHERKIRAGETLMRAGDPGNAMMVVILGEVRVLLAGSAGQQQIVTTLGPGSVVGEIALFDGKTRTADVVAATNGKVLTLERAALLRMLESDPHFALRVIEGLCGRLRSTLTQLESVLFQDVATRLATCLLNMASAKPPRRLDITQATLGQLVGASREIVNKRLRALASQGIVSLSPGRIVLLDEARLAQTIPNRTAGV
jgi:CRP-like cAMP-binding protein